MGIYPLLLIAGAAAERSGRNAVNSRVLQERIDERLENKEITEADAECFDELLDETEWVRASPDITDIFSEEISACFEGNRQVDEAARMIENRLNLFLAESAGILTFA